MKEKLNANLSQTDVKLQNYPKNLIMAMLIAITLSIPLGLKSQQYSFYYPQINFNYNTDENDFFRNSESFYNPFNQLKITKRTENPYKKANVEKMQINYQDPQKDNKSYLGVEINYDKNGNTTLYKKYNHKGKIIRHNESVYNEKGIILSYKDFKRNGKTSYWFENVLDEKSRIVESKILNSDASYKMSRIFVYNEKSRIVENNAYKGKDKKLYNRIVHTFYSNGEIESTANYNGKGKLKKFWSYACSNKAEEVKNLKDTIKICKISDFDKDANFTISNIYTGEDGMIYKYVKKYNKDSVLLEALNYNNKNILTSKTINTKTSDGWICKVMNMNKQQNIKHEIIYEYNDNKILRKSSQIYYKSNGKIRYKFEYLYDNDGLITDFKTYKKGGEQIKYSTAYQRKENGLPLMILTKNDKGETTFKTIYSYN